MWSRSLPTGKLCSNWVVWKRALLHQPKEINNLQRIRVLEGWGDKRSHKILTKQCFWKKLFFFLSKMSPSTYRMGSVKHFIFLFNEVSKRFNQMLSKHFGFSLITHALQACFFFLFKVFIYLASPGLSCGNWDLPSWPWKEPVPPALGAWSLSLWTTREGLLEACLMIKLGILL